MAKATTTKRSSARATTKKRATTAKTRGSGKRDLVKTPNATLFAKRDARGQFKDMAEKGKSQRADRRTTAKTKVRSGYGYRGDR